MRSAGLELNKNTNYHDVLQVLFCLGFGDPQDAETLIIYSIPEPSEKPGVAGEREGRSS